MGKLYAVEVAFYVDAESLAEASEVASEIIDLVLRFARASEGSGATKLEKVVDADTLTVEPVE